MKTLEHIKNSLSEYESGKLSLEDLQKNIEAELMGLEGPGTPVLIHILDNFVNQIELFIYFLPEQKRAKMVDEAIKLLRGKLQLR